MPNRLLKK